MIDIIEQTKKNKTYNFLYAGGVKLIQKSLKEDEDVLLAIMGNVIVEDFFEKGHSLSNTYSGTTVLTNKRIIFSFKMIGPELFREVNIEDIKYIEYKQGEFTNKIVSIETEKFNLQIIHLETFMTELFEKLRCLRAPYVFERKIKELEKRFQNGDIDEDEYNDKKETLLKEKEEAETSTNSNNSTVKD